jgi:hypothetical protein
MAPASQQDRQATVAEARSLPGKLDQPLEKALDRRRGGPALPDRPGLLHQAAGAPLAHREVGSEVLDDGPAPGWAHHFSSSADFRASLSSDRSAAICCRRRFASSSSFRRFASLTSRPPYFARQLWMVCVLVPCSRARSATFAPPSASFRIAMICASVDLLFVLWTSRVVRD